MSTTPTTPPAKTTTAVSRVEHTKKLISNLAPDFKAALPSHVKVEKFIRVAQTAVMNSPDLLKADQTSLFAACVKLAQKGLLPDNQEAALVIFNKKVGNEYVPHVQDMPMVKGILKMMRNSGEIGTPAVQVVYKNDKFRYWVDFDGEHLEHEPNLFSDRGDIIGVYSLVKFKDGMISIEVMTKAEVDKVMKASKSKFGPWFDWYEEMMKKTVLRRHSKRLPMSTDLEMVMQSDDPLFINNDPEPTPAASAPSKTPTKLAQQIADQEQPEPPASGQTIDVTANTLSEDETPL